MTTTNHKTQEEQAARRLAQAYPADTVRDRAAVLQTLATARLADAQERTAAACERIAAALEAANAREMYPFVFPPAAPPSVPMNPLNPVI